MDICFHFLTIMNNAADIHVQVFLWMYVLYLTWEYLGVELQNHGNSMFNFLRNCQTVSQSGCPILHFHQHCCHILANTCMLLSVSLIGARTVTDGFDFNDSEHVFMCLLSFPISSLEKSLYKYSAFF